MVKPGELFTLSNFWVLCKEDIVVKLGVYVTQFLLWLRKVQMAKEHVEYLMKVCVFYIAKCMIMLYFIVWHR